MVGLWGVHEAPRGLRSISLCGAGIHVPRFLALCLTAEGSIIIIMGSSHSSPKLFFCSPELLGSF